jgi:hypothetical protein
MFTSLNIESTEPNWVMREPYLVTVNFYDRRMIVVDSRSGAIFYRGEARPDSLRY